MIIEQSHIRINEYTRTGWPRTETLAIVLHWTATPGATAMGVRNWFGTQDLKERPSYASAHYAVGLEGEVVEIVPPDEYCRHVGSTTYTPLGIELMCEGKYKSPSWTCVGIEMCHSDMTGRFNERTVASTQALVRMLLDRYDLDIRAITTHKAIVGWKNCPRWYVDHPEDLEKFIEGVKNA